MHRLLSQSGNATVLAFYDHVRCPSSTGEWFEPRSHFVCCPYSFPTEVEGRSS